MDSLGVIIDELNQASQVLTSFLNDKRQLANTEHAAQLIAKSIENGGKIFSCGNGGSYCDAMHFAEELTGKFREERKPFPAIAISDPGYITCTANDYGYDLVFSRYLEALGNHGDVLLAISTSGNSQNVINAAITAQKQGIQVIALTGNDGGKLAKIADVEIRVPHNGYADRVQEVHIKVIHILILLTEKHLA